jgi:hypothetical protein
MENKCEAMEVVHLPGAWPGPEQTTPVHPEEHHPAETHLGLVATHTSDGLALPAAPGAGPLFIRRGATERVPDYNAQGYVVHPIEEW